MGSDPSNAGTVMKVAISGKGGVGKTTLAAMLAGVLDARGKPVIAIDADPDANLAAALGLSPDDPITPLSEMHDLIAERTGASEPGAYFRLNPRVDDLPERFARRIGGIRLLVLGGIHRGGSGCLCPASALLKALLIHLAIGRNEALIMDMEAGIEHLGRATAQSMEALLVVVDRGPWSVQTARRVQDLARDLGLARILAVANRVDCDADLRRLTDQLGDIPLIGHLPTDARLTAGTMQVDADGRAAPSAALLDHRPVLEHILAEVERRT
jgi:CO dehydrogenase maturation factor